MSDVFKEDFLQKLVAVHFPSGWYIVVQFVHIVTSDTPNPLAKLSTVKPNTIVYEREGVYDNAAGFDGNPFIVVFLPTQTEPLPGDPILQPIPCSGVFTYFDHGGDKTVGFDTAEAAFGAFPGDVGFGVGGFWGRHPKASYTRVDASFAAESDYSGPINQPFDGASASAFASYLGSHVAQSWITGPYTYDFLPLPSTCADAATIKAGPPADWFSTWTSDTIDPHVTTSKVYEHVMMIKAPRGSTKIPVLRVALTGGDVWQTKITAYKITKHKVDPGNVDVSTGRVYFPINPANDPVDGSDFGPNNGSFTVFANKNKDGTVLTIL